MEQLHQTYRVKLDSEQLAAYACHFKIDIHVYAVFHHYTLLHVRLSRERTERTFKDRF